jgi:ubiquinone/menaquinone biosynthesis C-methylase UbiE
MVTLKELLKYYESEGRKDHCQKVMYADGAHLNLRKIVTALLAGFMKRKEMCLDAGCAEGWYCRWLSAEAEFVVGLDMSIPKLKRAIAEPNSTNITYVMGSWDHLPFKNESFTIITFVEGPEHCLRPEHTIDELYRVARRQGFILVSAPIERSSNEKDPLAEPFEGHLSFFSPSSLKKLVEKRFKIVQMRFPSQSESAAHEIKQAISKTKFAHVIRTLDHFVLRDSILTHSPVPHGIIVGRKAE